MATLADLMQFFVGPGHDRPSIMTPAATARRKMFGPGRRGKFEGADLLELLGDPGLLLGGGAALGGLGMAAMRGAGRAAGREASEAGSSMLLRELQPRAANQLSQLAQGGQFSKAPQTTGGMAPQSLLQSTLNAPNAPGAQTVQPPMTMGKLGPVARMTSREPSGPVIPGGEPMPRTGPAQVTPEYEVSTQGILDVERPSDQQLIKAARPRQFTSRQAPESIDPSQEGFEFLRDEFESPITLEAPGSQGTTYRSMAEAMQAVQQSRGRHARRGPMWPRDPGARAAVAPQTVPTKRSERDLLLEKFTQNPELGERLMQTSPSSIKGPRGTALMNIRDRLFHERGMTPPEPPTKATQAAARASGGQIRQLSDMLKPLTGQGGTEAAASGAASREAVADQIRKKLQKKGTVVKKDELADILDRFMESRPFLQRPGGRQTIQTPSAQTGAPLARSLEPGGIQDLGRQETRDAWAESVVQGETPLEPGQQQHLKSRELEALLTRASETGKMAGEETLPDVPKAQQQAIRKVLRDRTGAPEEQQTAVRKVLRDELVPEEEKAAEVGATIRSASQAGDQPRGGELGFERNVRDRAEMRWAEQQESAIRSERARRPDLPRGGSSKQTPPQLSEEPSKALPKKLPGESRPAPNWAPRMSWMLRKSGQEVGDEWRALARLREVEDLAPEARSLAIGSEHPTLQKLAADPQMPKLIDRIDQIIERRGARGGSRGMPSPKSGEFQRLMGWTAYLPPGEKRKLAKRVQLKNPEAAKELRRMWNEATPPEMGEAPETLTIKPGLEPKPTKNTKRSELVELLMRHPEEFQEWAQTASESQSRDLSELYEANELAKRLQQNLRDQGVRGVRRGSEYSLFSPVQ